MARAHSRRRLTQGPAGPPSPQERQKRPRLCPSHLVSACSPEEQLAECSSALPSPALGFDLAAQLQDRLAQDLAQRPTRSRRTGWNLLGWMPTGLAAGAALVSGVWLGGLLLGTGAALPAASPAMARVFDPVPPGGLCAAAEICRLPRTLP